MQTIITLSNISIPNCPQLAQGIEVRLSDQLADQLVSAKLAKFKTNGNTKKAKEQENKDEEFKKEDEKDVKKSK